jgi:hypothetical protein
MHIRFAEPLAAASALARRTRLVGSLMVRWRAALFARAVDGRLGGSDRRRAVHRRKRDARRRRCAGQRAAATGSWRCVRRGACKTRASRHEHARAAATGIPFSSAAAAGDGATARLPRNAVEYVPALRDYAVQPSAVPLVTEQQPSLLGRFMDIVLGV